MSKMVNEVCWRTEEVKCIPEHCRIGSVYERHAFWCASDMKKTIREMNAGGKRKLYVRC